MILHPPALYEDEAQRLKDATGLVPVWIRSEEPVWAPAEIHVKPPQSGEWHIVGVRLFHRARQFVVHDATIAGEYVMRGPVDAGAYFIDDAPLQPLDPARLSGYRGDVLRFFAVDWRVTSPGIPLQLRVEHYDHLEALGGQPIPVPHFEGLVVLRQRMYSQAPIYPLPRQNRRT